jgi:hypothetical protein
MLPATALKHIHTLIVGAASVANERQQRLLLEAVTEIARKGLEQPVASEGALETPLSLHRPSNFRWQ